MTFINPIFDTDDIVTYSIGSGPYSVDFSASDWQESGNTCSVDLVYQILVTESGNPTTDLTATTPTSLSKVIDIQSAVSAISEIDHTVKVLAKTPSF